MLGTSSGGNTGKHQLGMQRTDSPVPCLRAACSPLRQRRPGVQEHPEGAVGEQKATSICVNTSPGDLNRKKSVHCGQTQSLHWQIKGSYAPKWVEREKCFPRGGLKLF